MIAISFFGMSFPECDTVRTVVKCFLQVFSCSSLSTDSVSHRTIERFTITCKFFPDVIIVIFRSFRFPEQRTKKFPIITEHIHWTSRDFVLHRSSSVSRSSLAVINGVSNSFRSSIPFYDLALSQILWSSGCDRWLEQHTREEHFWRLPSVGFF